MRKCPFCSIDFTNNPWHPLDCVSAPDLTEADLRQVEARHSRYRTEHREELKNEQD